MTDACTNSALSRVHGSARKLGGSERPYMDLAAATIAQALDDARGLSKWSRPGIEEQRRADLWLQTTGARWLELMGADPERIEQLLEMPSRVKGGGVQR